MKVILDIKDSKVPFVMELLKSFSFIKTQPLSEEKMRLISEMKEAVDNLKLVKKYPSLKEEFASVIDELEQNPEQGTKIGKRCFKIRISIASKGKGKSGGARVITNFTISENTVYLLSIYDKSEKDSLTDSELEDLLSLVP